MHLKSRLSRQSTRNVNQEQIGIIQNWLSAGIQETIDLRLDFNDVYNGDEMVPVLCGGYENEGAP